MKTLQRKLKQITKRFLHFGNSEIASHTILENGLRETVYANGVKVYVNYLDKDLETDFGTVKAESFLVGEAKA